MQFSNTLLSFSTFFIKPVKYTMYAALLNIYYQKSERAISRTAEHTCTRNQNVQYLALLNIHISKIRTRNISHCWTYMYQKSERAISRTAEHTCTRNQNVQYLALLNIHVPEIRTYNISQGKKKKKTKKNATFCAALSRLTNTRSDFLPATLAMSPSARNWKSAVC